MTEQNKDGAKCGCAVLEGRSTRFSFVLCLAYHFKRQTVLNFFFSLRHFSYCVNSKMLKVTYHENLTFPGFKCYNQVPSASTNQGNVKKINPVTLF